MFQNFVVDFADRVADNDLILTAALHDCYNTVHSLENVGIGFFLVLELETQARHAVSKRIYVFFAADVFNNVSRKFFILSSHETSSFISKYFSKNRT